MLIVSKGALAEIEAAITSALIGATDHRGRQKIIGTIDPAHLRNVALGALTAALGDVVWPSDKVVEREPEERLPWLKTVYPRS
jgi:hypothetical protein